VGARAFLHELLGFLASGPWVGLLRFLYFYFMFLSFGANLSFFRFSFFFQHPQEGELFKLHGSLGIWVNSIL
jgi:hypothetical protein